MTQQVFSETLFGFDLPYVLDRIRELPLNRLPELFGQLEIIRSTAQLKMTVPAPLQTPNQLLDAKAAAVRLGMSEDYVYRHASNFPFTRRNGRSVRFSSAGIDAYIAKGRH